MGYCYMTGKYIVGKRLKDNRYEFVKCDGVVEIGRAHV